MGGVQKRRTLIVSKLESFYGAGGGTLPLPLKKPHWGFFLTRLRVPLSYINKGVPIGAPLVPVAGLEPARHYSKGF